MVLTTYICDRCKHKVEDQRELFRVVVGLAEYQYSYGVAYYHIQNQIHKEKQLCRACLLELGIVVPNKTETAPATTPTFDEVIREMIREEIQAIPDIRQ